MAFTSMMIEIQFYINLKSQNRIIQNSKSVLVILFYGSNTGIYIFSFKHFLKFQNGIIYVLKVYFVYFINPYFWLE